MQHEIYGCKYDVYIYIYSSLLLNENMYTRMCVYENMYVCMCIYIYIYARFKIDTNDIVVVFDTFLRFRHYGYLVVGYDGFSCTKIPKGHHSLLEKKIPLSHLIFRKVLSK